MTKRQMSAEDIVISGMGGRFPESRNVNEFCNNLFEGIDMVTNKDDRWPDGTYGFANRMGRIPDFHHFDGAFFGLLQQMNEVVEPSGRLLLETAYEAIVDAGINPQSMRGTNTGVVVGYSHYPYTEGLMDEVHPDWTTQKSTTALRTMTNLKALLPNRISFVFDFKGPSLTTDTACSASGSAFTLAVNEMLLVGGIQLNLEPFMVQMQQEAGICSPRGVSAVLDESADGFVKGDAVACVLLQRRATAKRVYATVRSARMNVDGYKKVGTFFPSSEAQQTLMVKTYKEAGIDPLKLTYFEGHLTGTRVGDPEEVKAIYKAYCEGPGRGETLPLGALKGNIGHTEGCSGLASVIKVCLAFENERLPPNINIEELKHEIKQFCPPLYPNTEVIPYKPGLAAINNFGVGGLNVHILIEPNYKTETENNLKIAEEIPRIVNICGRTEEAVRHVMDFIENNPNKVTKDFLALLTDTMKYKPSINSSGFPFRGSLIIKKVNEQKGEIKYTYKRQMSEMKSKTVRPLWLLFPGLGGQWTAMAKALMPIDIFSNKVEECHQILTEFNVDLKDILLSENKTAISTLTAKFCSTTAIEIALFEVLKALDITPDGIIGHSFGEIACAYADGCLTAREAMITTYMRGLITENNKNIPKGLMAVCGISKNEAKKLIRDDVVIACYNSKNTVVLSGSEEPMKEIILDLKTKNLFVYVLESSRIALHNPMLEVIAKSMIDLIKKHVPNPRMRSKKWISTSILENEPKEEVKNYAGAEYFVNNLISPVFFYDKFKTLPSDAIVVEIGPHGLFRKIVNETLEGSSYMTLIKKDSNDTNLDNFFAAISKLYELGINPSIENLYPSIEYPVSRGTPSIGSLIKWNHSQKFSVRLFPDYNFRSTSSDMNVTINIKLNEESFYSGHCIDGNILFPATGYLMLAWRIYAASLAKVWNDVPVVWEQVQFKRAVFLSEDNPTNLKVVYSRKTGDFVILENDNECCRGKVYGPIDDSLLLQSQFYENQNRVLDNEVILTKDEIYKDLRVRGYDYSGEFQKLIRIRTNDFQTLLGECEWDGNIVPLLDNLLQAQMLASPFRKLMVPVMVKNMRIDPKVLFETIRHNKVYEKCQNEPTLMPEAVEMAKNEVVANNEDNLKLLQDQHKERFAIFKSSMPFYFNTNTRILIAPGVEIEQVLAFPIPRKMPSNLVLDSYEWVANEDNSAINECDKQYIIEYLEVCKSVAMKLKLIGLKQLKCDFNHKNIEPEVIERQRYDNSEHKVMLKILDRICGENQNILRLNSVEDIVKVVETDKSLDLTRDVVNQVSKNERLIRTLIDIVSENNATKRELKVTEINLTGDVLAEEVESYLANSQIMSTDVDYKLMVKSVETVSETIRSKATEWESKDMPDLPMSDLIIYRDSTELWNINTEELVRKFNEAIVENGFIVIVGRYRMTEPEEAINSLINENYITNDELEGRLQNLFKLLTKLKLRIIANKCDSVSTMAMMFRKVTEKKNITETRELIEVKTERDEKWFEAIRESLQKSKDALDDGVNASPVWLIANDTNINGIVGLVNCLRLEPGGQCFRCLFDMDSNIKLPIDWSSKPYSDILTNDLVVNVIKNGKLGTFRHTKLPKDYDKTVSNQYFLNQGANKDLSSLAWFDLRNLTPNSEPYDLVGNEIELIAVNIYRSGLIFKDVMFATGRIPSGQSSLFTDCVLGLEFAGRRIDTGERVMGLTDSRAFATVINANSNWLTTIPDHWSMSEAVTILTSYSTLWYGLIERARLRKGESILIHSGAGGIGQSAINICKHYECDIYVTVGNEEKKRFIVEEYGIPENHIFSSRDVQFKYKIIELTKGKGVDLVVNSLTGEKLDAGYEILSEGGRFVEIGKYDMFQNKQLSMFDFLKDISFIGVALDVGLENRKCFAKDFFKWMHENSTNGCVKPLNKIVFNANEADKAFRYMTTGKHIGKIVIKIREEEENRGPVMDIKPAQEMIVTTKTYLNPNKVYIIIGGLGGFGLELIHWMISMGGRKFLLTSRNGIKNNYQKFVINRLRSYGERLKFFNVSIEVLKNDCLTVESAQQVLSETQNMGRIGGIFNLTIILNECLIEKMSYEQFCESSDCKFRVFDNFDKLSRKLDYNLDYFVVFSSVICGKGNTGQTNYAFGNSLCERICEQRRRDGLHGLAIQFGPVGDTGVFVSQNQVLELSTLQKQRIHSCCEVLDKLLTATQPVVTSWVNAERVVQNGQSRHKRIISELWAALGIDSETTPNNLTLGEIGLESMFAIELQQELEREYNMKFGINHIKTITVGLLKDYQKSDTGYIKQYLDEMKSNRQKLIVYNFTMPTEPYTKLNNVTKGRPIYLMPPFEITFSAYEKFAKKFDRPVIGLNWTRDVSKLETVKEINKYFEDLLKKLEPKGDYDLVGSLDGALLVAKQLMKGRLRKGVIIDVLNDEKFLKEKVSEDSILEFYFSFLFSGFPDSLRDKMYRGIFYETQTSGKIKRLAEEMKDFVGRGLIAPDLEEILGLALKRATLLWEYRLKKKSKFGNKLKETIGKKWAKKSGKLHVIKAFLFNKVEDIKDKANTSREIYLLPDLKESSDVLSVEAVDYHNSFDVTSDEIGNKILNIFKN